VSSLQKSIAVNNKIINLLIIYFGGLGMIWLSLQDDTIFIFFHPIAILSIVLFTIGLLRSIGQVLSFGLTKMKYEIISLALFLLILLGFTIKKSEVFKSEKVLGATLNDDLSSINLVLRQDGSFETTSSTIYGRDLITGKYELLGDTVSFYNQPYINDFIPSKILIDKERERVWIIKMASGEFDTTEHFARYFEIVYDDLE